MSELHYEVGNRNSAHTVTTFKSVSREWHEGLEKFEFAPGMSFEFGDAPLRYLYFVTEGIVSERIAAPQVDDAQGGDSSCLRLVGVGGLLGSRFASSRDVSPFWYTAEEQVYGYKIRAQIARLILESHPPSREIIDRYNRLLAVEDGLVAGTTLPGTSEERVAFLLLQWASCVDSLSGLAVTHARIAQQFGMRRTTVSDAVNGLVEAGLVANTRGSFDILDYPGLAKRTRGLWPELRQERHHFDQWLFDHADRCRSPMAA